MKKLFYILSLAAAASLTVLSCQKEAEVNPREPSPAEDPNCYGVYFPTQEASGDHVYNPTQDPVIEITVARTNDKGDISVPLKGVYSEADIFVPETISFADGQKETTFKVRFDAAKEGVKYEAHYTIEGDDYASLYNSNPIGIDFSVMRVEMLQFKTEDGSAVASITATDNVFWGEVHDDITIQYYEVDGIRYCETIGGKLNSPADGTVGEGPWGTGVQLKFKWYTKKTVEVDGVDYQWIEVEPNYIGYDSSNGPVYMGDYFHMRADMGLSNGDYTSSYDRYVNGSDGYLPSFYDGHGGFIFHSAYWIHGTTSWYGYKDKCPEMIAGGYVRVDYTLKAIESDYTQDGVLPLAFCTGVDVTKVKFVAVAGEITATQVGNQVAAIAAGTAENVYTLDALVDYEYKGEPAKLATTGVTLAETGVYTIVAVTLNDKSEVADSGSLLANYVAAGDEELKAVDITCGVSPASKYPGVNTDGTLEIWAYGSDIVDMKIAAVKYIDLAGNLQGALAAVKAGKSLTAAQIESVNNGGYVGLAEKLLPGTEYYAVVWAQNGFEEEFFISEESCFTTGDPLPIYLNYSLADYYADGAIANREAIVGTTWNYYAVDWYGSLGLREYLGKVKITASESATEGPDDDGLYDEYVLLDGLFPNAVVDGPEYGYEVGDCVVEFDVYNGIIYSFAKTTYDEKSKINTYSSVLDGWYNASYYCAFIPVADGYYAFMDVSGQGYDFCGLRIVNEYVWDAFLDLLLVNPAKDENGIAPAAVQAKVDAAKKKMNEIAVASKNFVETPKGRIQSVVEKYQKSVMVYDVVAVDGICPVKTVKATLSSTDFVPATKSVKGYLQAPVVLSK